MSILKTAIISPGRITPNKLKEHNDFFIKLSNDITKKQKTSYEIIGHGSSSFRYYPMGINCKGLVYGNGFLNKNTPALDIIDLIKTSISVDPSISIELDVHYPPKNHYIKKKFPNNGAYILHNIPKWEKPYMKKDTVLNYFNKNTIKNVVDFFVRNEYYHKSKVYIELKLNKECFDIHNFEEHCKEQSYNLAQELKQYTLYRREDNENWLCITSFSPLALKIFRDTLPNDFKNHFDYVLIAGYTGSWIKSKLAQLKGFVPRFDSKIISFIIQSEWIDTIWFSAQGIPQYKKIFNEIIQKRKELDIIKKINFSFSTYQKTPRKMVNLMHKNRTEKLNAEIRSFMFDLDYKKEFVNRQI